MEAVLLEGSNQNCGSEAKPQLTWQDITLLWVFWYQLELPESKGSAAVERMMVYFDLGNRDFKNHSPVV
jgi:hypothetical protein